MQRVEQAVNDPRGLGTSVTTLNMHGVGCSVERYGMFLSSYNDVLIYGITNRAAQDQVLEKLSAYHEKAHPPTSSKVL